MGPEPMPDFPGGIAHRSLDEPLESTVLQATSGTVLVWGAMDASAFKCIHGVRGGIFKASGHEVLLEVMLDLMLLAESADSAGMFLVRRQQIRMRHSGDSRTSYRMRFRGPRSSASAAQVECPHAVDGSTPLDGSTRTKRLEFLALVHTSSSCGRVHISRLAAHYAS